MPARRAPSGSASVYPVAPQAAALEFAENRRLVHKAELHSALQGASPSFFKLSQIAFHVPRIYHSSTQRKDASES